MAKDVIKEKTKEKIKESNNLPSYTTIDNIMLLLDASTVQIKDVSELNYNRQK